MTAITRDDLDVSELFNPPKPKGLLFHYTSPAGFLGIIESGSLWASNIHYLNDSAEFAYTVDLAKREIRHLAGNAPAAGKQRLNELTEQIESIRRLNIFVFSFSEDGDLLSQWRGYSPRTGGLSLAFDLDLVLPRIEQQGFRLTPCIYNPAVHHEIVQALIRRELARPWAGPHPPGMSSHSIFIDEVAAAAPLLKDPSFSEEREWRLVSGPTSSDLPSVKHRLTATTIAPYFDLAIRDHLGQVPVTHVILGPSTHQEWLSDSVLTLLNRFAGGHGRITYSRIPFRAW